MARRADRVVTTVLFTDIVASTERARELGDARWKALLARHHTIVRRELKRFRGRERDTAGDGFFATFARPGDAVRCAVAIVAAVRELGIELRAGLHTGEVELSPREVRGIAVHLGARVAASAEPGQILLSSTTSELIAGSGIDVVDVGARQLKGIEGRTRLLAVTAVDGETIASPLAEDEAASRRGRVTTSTSRTRPALGAAAIVIVIAAIAVIAVVALTRSGPEPPQPRHERSPTPTQNDVIAVDPSTGHIDLIAPNVIQPTQDSQPRIVVGEGSVWIRSRNLVAIDPNTAAVKQPFENVGSYEVGTSAEVAVGARAVWVPVGGGFSGTRSAMARFDPGLLKPLGTVGFDTTAVATDVAVGDDVAWVCFSDGTVRRLDAFSAKPDGPAISVGGNLDAIALDEDAIWVLDETHGVVTHLDASGDVVKRIPVNGSPRAIVAGEGAVWLLDPIAKTVTPIDPASDTLQQPIATTAADPNDIAVGSGAVWVADGGGNLIRIDAANGQPHAFRLGVPLAAVGVGDGSGDVWLAVGTYR